MRLPILAATAALALTTACTPRPDSIAPVPMGDAYSSLSCAEAQERLRMERQTLVALEKAQNSAATGDAIGVFLIGVPVSNMSGGNKAGDIGAAKGKIIALETRLERCR